MRCSHHPACPGCPLLGQGPAAQLAIKKSRIESAFSLYAHLPGAPEVQPAARDAAYRHRFKLPVDHGPDGGVRMGLSDARTGRIVDTPDCPVLAPGLQALTGPLRAWLRNRRTVHSVDLRVSAATGEAQLVLACHGGDLPGGQRAIRALQDAAPALASISVSTADKARKRVMGHAHRVVAGRTHIDEAIGSTRYRIHPGAFFQVDPATAERLHAIVRAFVGDARSLVDLYAGVGAYALALAPGRSKVVMVEEVEAAAQAAREVAPPNVQVIAGKTEAAALRGRFDCVILNPARRGADLTTLAMVAKLAPRAVYVSCGPESLARDLDILAFHGLRVRDIAAVDLFPHTPEVETVVLLEQGKPLVDWPVPGGRAMGPWGGSWSGVRGKPERFVALLLGDVPERGTTRLGSWRRFGTVAGHALVRLEPEGNPTPLLAHLARLGHGLAGHQGPTQRFFAEKAGLLRPFLHAERAGAARAPLHGDLVQALRHLGADAALIARAGGPPMPA